MDVLSFIKDYQKILINRIDDVSLSITSGGVTDWEDYKARVGEIQGVTYALDDLKAMLKKVKYIDDTDRTWIAVRPTPREVSGGGRGGV